MKTCPCFRGLRFTAPRRVWLAWHGRATATEMRVSKGREEVAIDVMTHSPDKGTPISTPLVERCEREAERREMRFV